jgi:hypothetical protein
MFLFADQSEEYGKEFFRLASEQGWKELWQTTNGVPTSAGAQRGTGGRSRIPPAGGRSRWCFGLRRDQPELVNWGAGITRLLSPPTIEVALFDAPLSIPHAERSRRWHCAKHSKGKFKRKKATPCRLHFALDSLLGAVYSPKSYTPSGSNIFRRRLGSVN